MEGSPPQRKIALMTGGCGFIGHHFVEYLIETSDYDLVIIDKLSYASMGYERLRALKPEFGDQIGRVLDKSSRIRIFSHDLCNPIPEGMAHELDPSRIDIIVHMAAETHVDNSIVDPVPFVQNNVLSTLHLLEFARTLPNLRAFFYFSTDEVFGTAPSDSPGFVEDAPHNPTNPYSASKSASEMICLAYFNTYGLPLMSVNCMNAFGERQHPEKFIPICIDKILKGEEISIHAYPGGKKAGSRFYIHARHIADAVMFLLNNGKRGEKYNIKGEQEVDNLELAQMIADILGKPLNYSLFDRPVERPGHDLRYALDGTKLEQIGWVPPSSFREGLEKVVQWTLAHPHWLDQSKFEGAATKSKLASKL
jgi:dTDP-glucose 4,6-dehydratase